MNCRTLTTWILLLHFSVANADSEVKLNGFSLKMSILAANELMSKHVSNGYKAQNHEYDRRYFSFVEPVYVLSLKKGGYIDSKYSIGSGPKDQSVIVTTGDKNDQEIFLIDRREAWPLDSAPHKSVFIKNLATNFGVPEAWINSSSYDTIFLRFLLLPSGGRQNDGDIGSKCRNQNPGFDLDKVFWHDGYKPDGMKAYSGVWHILPPQQLKTNGNEPVCSAYFQLEAKVGDDKVMSYTATLINYSVLYKRYYQHVVVPQRNQTQKEIDRSPKAKF